jgi:hypothetical protein
MSLVDEVYVMIRDVYPAVWMNFLYRSIKVFLYIFILLATGVFNYLRINILIIFLSAKVVPFSFLLMILNTKGN